MCFDCYAFFLTAKVAKEVAEGTKDVSLFLVSHGRHGKDASLFLMEHGFNGLAKAKRGFSLILIATLLFDFHGFNSAISSLEQILSLLRSWGRRARVSNFGAG